MFRNQIFSYEAHFHQKQLFSQSKSTRNRIKIIKSTIYLQQKKINNEIKLI